MKKGLGIAIVLLFAAASAGAGTTVPYLDYHTGAGQMPQSPSVTGGPVAGFANPAAWAVSGEPGFDFWWSDRSVLEGNLDNWGLAAGKNLGFAMQRSAFRDAARAFGVPGETVNQVSRRIPWRDERSLPEIFRTGGLLRDYPSDREPHRTALRLAERIRGFPRHLGLHPGGIVMADGPIDRHAPLEKAAKGVVVTQYEMFGVEDIGLVKIDLLGNRSLGVLEDALASLRRRGITPPEDGAVLRPTGRGRREGIINSPSRTWSTLPRPIPDSPARRL